MKILLTILTNKKRYQSACETIKSVLESDWSSEIRVIKDDMYTNKKHPISRVSDAFRGILSDFVSTDYDYLLYLEDDTLVNKHIRHNLEALIKEHKINYGFLYSNESLPYGTQGIIISKKAAKCVLSEEWIARHDPAVYEILQRNNFEIYRFSPNLVQQRPGISSVDGHFGDFQSEDFDVDYKLR